MLCLLERSRYASNTTFPLFKSLSRGSSQRDRGTDYQSLPSFPCGGREPFGPLPSWNAATLFSHMLLATETSTSVKCRVLCDLVVLGSPSISTSRLLSASDRDPSSQSLPGVSGGGSYGSRDGPRSRAELGENVVGILIRSRSAHVCTIQ